MADFQFEKRYLKLGYRKISGVDEAGRGALCGPVVAAAVIMPISAMRGKLSREVKEINDSKALSPKKRRKLALFIIHEALSVGIGLASNEEIDRENIFWASLKAMKRAIQNLPIPPDFILVDGFNLRDIEYPHVCIPQGDSKSVSVAAASIIAKVFRDEIMILLDKIYKGYALARNKGYGTKEHYRSLREKGPTPLHRFSFNLGQKSNGS
ncbi:MAG: ribonuclease HII [Candidatus Aminicenantaceae bacterium]